MGNENIDQEILNKYMDEVQQAIDGELDVLDVATRLKELRDSFKDLYKEFKSEIIEEREKYPDKETVTRNGYEINIQSRKYYGYSNDEEHGMLKQQIKNREALMKKAANSREPVVNPATGEEVTPATISESTYPVLKYTGK